MVSKIFELYQDLLSRYNEPDNMWPQWCAVHKNEKLRELIAIGAILTQRTSWRNAYKALLNLRSKNFLSLKAINNLKDYELLTALIRPAGFYTTKPKRLVSFAEYVLENYTSLEKMLAKDPKILREELLGVYGIGQETADTILLYVLDKPSFIADEYARRFLLKHNLIYRDEKADYIKIKKIFESSLPKETKTFQRYHILMIIDQKGLDWSKMEIV